MVSSDQLFKSEHFGKSSFCIFLPSTISTMTMFRNTLPMIVCISLLLSCGLAMPISYSGEKEYNVSSTARDDDLAGLNRNISALMAQVS